MAIQFRCPHCNAEIKVPDGAAGKKGSCPSCREKLLVPSPATPPAAAAPTPAAPASEATKKTVVSGTAAETPKKKVVKKKIIKKVVRKKVAPAAETETPLINLGEAQPAANATPEQPPAEQPRVVRRKRKRKSSLGALVPIVLGIGLVGGVAYWFIQQEAGGLSGKIAAAPVNYPQAIRPEYVDRENIDVSSETLDAVLADLEQRPRPISSGFGHIDVIFSAKSRGVQVQTRRGPKGVWYRVPIEKPELLDYIKKNRADWEKARLEERDAAAKRFVEAIANTLENPSASIPMGDLMTYRDDLGLNTMTGGLGFVVEAKVKSQPYRVAFEDSSSNLYFLMPPDVKSFRLTGRKLPDGTTPFQGSFVIAVKGEMINEGKPPAAAKPDASGPEDDIAGMSEQLPKDDDSGLPEDIPGLSAGLSGDDEKKNGEGMDGKMENDMKMEPELSDE